MPPISSCTFFIGSDAMQVAATRRPVPTEPVNVIALTPGWRSIASPTTEPRPMIRLNTPGGTPARAMISARAVAVAGTSSAGLSTTQLP